MANTVLMPKAGISVESCIIGNWKKNVGDSVKIGDILFDYETDKAVFECESTAEGTLLEIFFQNGEEVACMIPVCAVGTPGEDISALRPAGAAAAEPAAAPAPAAEAPAAAPAAPAAPKAAPTGPVAQAVLMPKAGISVESCIIGSWKKNVGDSVKVGDILFDYETDKAVFECESTAEGTLLDIFYQSGDEVPCMMPVCAVGNPGDDTASLRGDAPVAEAAPAVEAALAAAAVVEAPAAATGEKGAKISPRAKKMAASLHVDASQATPTGPNGRVIARDIERLAAECKTGTGIGGRVFEGAAAPAAAPAAAAAPAPAPAPAAAEAEYTDEKFTKIRKTIASSMMASLQNMAQLTHHHSCDASQIMALRKIYKEKGEALGLNGISINDLVLFAVSRTLKQHPDMNAHLINGDTMRRFKPVHLGVAVDTPRGLMVPTIFNADTKSLAEISKEAKELAAMCKAGNISPDLLTGATFTVSNLGSVGVEMFTPIINPPQTGILGVCGITTRVRNGKDGSIETYPAMGLSVTYDHRAVDGAPASRFARDLGKNLENIQLLMAL